MLTLASCVLLCVQDYPAVEFKYTVVERWAPSVGQALCLLAAAGVTSVAVRAWIRITRNIPWWMIKRTLLHTFNLD